MASISVMTALNAIALGLVGVLNSHNYDLYVTNMDKSATFVGSFKIQHKKVPHRMETLLFDVTGELGVFDDVINDVWNLINDFF